MSQQTLSEKRVHHFYVAIAKFVFHHPGHGIVSVQDPIRLRVAEEYGLSPLILYGVTVAGLPIRWMTFSLADHPKAFQDVLQEGWQRAEGLRGRPDSLLVSRQLAIASPNLAGEMAKIGVRVEVADAKEKIPSRFPALRPGRQSVAVEKAQTQGPPGSRGDPGLMRECAI